MLVIMSVFRENLNPLNSVALKCKCLGPAVREKAERRTMIPNMIGAYGPWAAGLSGDGPARLSFRNPRYQQKDLDAWRRKPEPGSRSACSSPIAAGTPKARFSTNSFTTDCTSST